jgi:hypothetical protein
VGFSNRRSVKIKSLMAQLHMHTDGVDGPVLPTSGFGSIQFAGRHQAHRAAPFVRISVRDSPDVTLQVVQGIFQQTLANGFSRCAPTNQITTAGSIVLGRVPFTEPLLCHCRPSLILSVTGGAKSFNLPPNILSALRSGLIRVGRAGRSLG